jgi:hypothetical protein
MRAGPVLKALAARTVATWVATLPEPATSERVRDDFFYVRVPGHARRWIPIEIEVDERTVRLTSHVLIPPEEDAESFWRFLLRTNADASDAAFAIDPDGVVLLVGRTPCDGLTEDDLDRIVGAIVTKTERTFRTLLRIGFASLFSD